MQRRETTRANPPARPSASECTCGHARAHVVTKRFQSKQSAQNRVPPASDHREGEDAMGRSFTANRVARRRSPKTNKKQPKTRDRDTTPKNNRTCRRHHHYSRRDARNREVGRQAVKKALEGKGDLTMMNPWVHPGSAQSARSCSWWARVSRAIKQKSGSSAARRHAADLHRK